MWQLDLSDTLDTLLQQWRSKMYPYETPETEKTSVESREKMCESTDWLKDIKRVLSTTDWLKPNTWVFGVVLKTVYRPVHVYKISRFCKATIVSPRPYAPPPCQYSAVCTRITRAVWCNKIFLMSFPQRRTGKTAPITPRRKKQTVRLEVPKCVCWHVWKHTITQSDCAQSGSNCTVVLRTCQQRHFLQKLETSLPPHLISPHRTARCAPSWLAKP